jgi:hypothetical protein
MASNNAFKAFEQPWISPMAMVRLGMALTRLAAAWLAVPHREGAFEKLLESLGDQGAMANPAIPKPVFASDSSPPLFYGQQSGSRKTPSGPLLTTGG